MDHILDSRVSSNTLQYLVKWKGYSFEDSTWENVTNLDNSQTAIKTFHKHFPNAPRPMSTGLRFVTYQNMTEPPQAENRSWSRGLWTHFRIFKESTRRIVRTQS